MNENNYNEGKSMVVDTPVINQYPLMSEFLDDMGSEISMLEQSQAILSDKLHRFINTNTPQTDQKSPPEEPINDLRGALRKMMLRARTVRASLEENIKKLEQII